MGLGFTTAGGNDALFQLLSQRRAAALQQALEERNRADRLNQQGIENDLRRRQLDQQDHLRQDALAEQKRQHDLADQDRNIGLGNTLAEQLPAGAFLPENDQAVGMLRTAGRGSLLSAQPAIPAMGPEFQGPMQNATVAEAQAGRPGGFIKTASAKQIADQAREDATAAAAKRQEEQDAEIARHNRAVENKPAPLSTVTIQTVDAQGNPVTRVIPKGQAVGQDFAAKPSAATMSRVDSAKAVKQTGEDIIATVSDPKVADMLGPALGRYNTLREFIGDPPPELSELAGQIESYALANMGVHGMRSAQGAEQVKRLLDQRHTPASLAATIRGLNKFSEHFIGNQKPGGNATPPTDTKKPTAADLIKKYGGG